MEEAGELILVRVMGSHFLWKMVRRMVGAMVEVGRGQPDAGGPSAPSKATRQRFSQQRTAPPLGLFLERVLYPGDAPPGPAAPGAEPVAVETTQPARSQSQPAASSRVTSVTGTPTRSVVTPARSRTPSAAGLVDDDDVGDGADDEQVAGERARQREDRPSERVRGVTAAAA